MSNNRTLSPASGLKRNPWVRVGKRENSFHFLFVLALQLRALSHALSNGRKKIKEKRRRNKQTNVCKQAEFEIIAV